MAVLLVAAFAFSACSSVSIPGWAKNPPETATEMVEVLIDNGYENATLSDNTITGTKTVDEKDYMVTVMCFDTKEEAGMTFFMVRGMLQGMVDYAKWADLDEEDADYEQMQTIKKLNFSFGSDNITVSGTVEEKDMSTFVQLSGNFIIIEGYGDMSAIGGIV
jgi:hypothetical protein